VFLPWCPYHLEIYLSHPQKTPSPYLFPLTFLTNFYNQTCEQLLVNLKSSHLIRHMKQLALIIFFSFYILTKISHNPEFATAGSSHYITRQIKLFRFHIFTNPCWFHCNIS
jgi:hypothetical protein